jgi:hypothetical protein
MTLLHIGGGGASRAPDISRLSLCNTSTGQRSVFFLRSSGCCTILPSSKTENTLGGTKSSIPRLYESRVSTLLLQYVYLFRRYHCYFTQLCFGGAGSSDTRSSIQSAFQHQLLINRGKCTTGPWNRLVFSKLIKKVSDIDMKFSGYRHYANWAAIKLVLPSASVHLKFLLESDPEYLSRAWESNSDVIRLALLPVQETMMRQSGHTPKTALNAYSVDPASHSDISEYAMNLYFDCSKLWYVCLFFYYSFFYYFFLLLFFF